MKTLFLAWQDPESRSWFPVGRLSNVNGIYRFVYTHGAREAQEKCSFHPLESFDSLEEAYESDELFPLFSNRIPRPTRPDYGSFIKWLNVPADQDDPIALLARSGGKRQTDYFEVFPCPERDEKGEYHIHFFVHGVRHIPNAGQRIEKLVPGEQLLMLPDVQNTRDPDAVLLRTSDSFEGDCYLVGFCPRYLAGDISCLIRRKAPLPTVAVERVNPPPAPLQFRLLCNMTACWPNGEFEPFSGKEYQPLPPEPEPD